MESTTWPTIAENVEKLIAQALASAATAIVEVLDGLAAVAGGVIKGVM